MKLVCLGDSLTYGYEVRRAAVWPTLAAKETGVEIVNRGVNGLLTAGMRALLAEAVLDAEADAVLLMGGANDILSGMGMEEARENMAHMAGRSENAGVRALVGIPVPFCPPIREDWAAMADFAAAAPVYNEYAVWLRSFCAERGHATVDFREALARHVRDTGVNPRDLYKDGLHLNEDGHRVFAAALAGTLCALGLTG